MAKKQEAKVKEFRVEKREDGQTIVVTVYEAQDKPKEQKVRCRGRQTKDFNLIGGWQRDRSKAPTC